MVMIKASCVVLERSDRSGVPKQAGAVEGILLMCRSLRGDSAVNFFRCVPATKLLSRGSPQVTS